MTSIEIKALIAERLRVLREQSNYTQEYIAQQLHITQSGYARIENKGNLTVTRLHELVMLYNISLKDFFEGNIIKKNTPI